MDEGILAACAGEPPTGLPFPVRVRVYPRVCGGAFFEIGQVQQQEGLSPRVRGSLNGGKGIRENQGSIPACAGEPIS